MNTYLNRIAIGSAPTKGCSASTKGCSASTKGCSASTKGCSASTKGCSAYEIKEFILDILIDMGLADTSDRWTKNTQNIYTLCTDQLNIAFAQRNARPTYFMEFYSKVPLREDGPTRHILKSDIEEIRRRLSQ